MVLLRRSAASAQGTWAEVFLFVPWRDGYSVMIDGCLASFRVRVNRTRPRGFAHAVLARFPARWHPKSAPCHCVSGTVVASAQASAIPPRPALPSVAPATGWVGGCSSLGRFRFGRLVGLCVGRHIAKCPGVRLVRVVVERLRGRCADMTCLLYYSYKPGRLPVPGGRRRSGASRSRGGVAIAPPPQWLG